MTLEQAQLRLSHALMVIIIVLMACGTTMGIIVAQRLSVSPSDVYKEVKLLRAKLDQSESDAQLVFNVLEESGSAVVALNEHGVVTLWSQGAESLFGVGREDAEGFGIAHMLPEGMRLSHRTRFDAAMQDRVHPFQRTIECEAQRSTGEALKVRINLWVIPSRMSVAVFTKLSDSGA